MSIPMTAPQVLAREFFEIRGKILEIAASLDRMDRAEGSVDVDQRYLRLREGLALLLSQSDDRAEQIQLLFSREYRQDWPAEFGLLAR